MSVDSLEETEDNPNVHGQDMKILGDAGVHNGCANGSKTKKEHLNRRGIFSSQTEGSRVLVVNLVDCLVERSPVERTVGPVMPSILDDEEDSNLIEHLPYRWEWDVCLETEVLCERVEEPL